MILDESPPEVLYFQGYGFEWTYAPVSAGAGMQSMLGPWLGGRLGVVAAPSVGKPWLYYYTQRGA